MAIRIRTDVTSKGRSRSRKRTRLRSEVAQRRANGEEDVGEQAEQCSDAGKADEVRGLTAAGALLFAGIQQHDDEGEQHHDGARVDDDLRGGEELGSEQQIEDGQRGHDDDQRERAVDRMPLQQQIQRAGDAQCSEDKEDD